MNGKVAVAAAGLALAGLAIVFGAMTIRRSDNPAAAPDTSPATSAAATPGCAATEPHDHAGQPASPCATPADSGDATFVATTNSWVDTFDRGATRVAMSGGYDVFDALGYDIKESVHFRQNDHWMVDVDPGADGFGGATMRPDQSFKFEDGKLVIEADTAAGIASYEGNAWVEIGLSTAPAPTGDVVDSLYAYGQFGGAYSFGCRLQSTRVPTCALYTPDGTRTWEMSYFQHVAPNVFGGVPAEELENAWRVCGPDEPDLNCRDRFRLELTRTSLVLYVNGERYFEQSGADLFPDEIVNGDVFVYFSDWLYKPGAERVRFHWDRLAINPPG